MKNLFDKVSESIKNTCKEAVDQTQKTVDQTKYRSELVSLKNELKKLYQKLGEESYKNYINKQDVAVSAPLCNRITNLKKEIEKLEKSVNDVSSKQKDSFDAYKREVRQTWEENEVSGGKVPRSEEGVKMLKFCPRCNIGNNPKAQFCIHCGQKL